LISLLGLHFFGLTPDYKKQVYREVHDLVYHGNGGFIHSEVYSMPIHIRRYHIKLINDHHKNQKEEINKQQSKSTNSTPRGPNTR